MARRSSSTITLWKAGATLIALLATLGGPGGARAAAGPSATGDHGASEAEVVRSVDPVPGQYVVVLTEVPDAPTAARGATVAETAAALAADVGAEVEHTYDTVLAGFSASMSPEDAAALAADPRVASVSEDTHHHGDEIEAFAPWGLDRTDQRDLPLDTEYSYGRTGEGVTAYVLDSGIRGTHSDFQDGAGSRVRAGFTVDSPADSDCSGHGTHVAGILGGERYGIAKEVDLVAVKVFEGCTESTETSDLIAALDWVVDDADLTGDGDAQDAGDRRTVANMSLGGPPDEPFEDAVAAATSKGVQVVASAGNTNTDACNRSPANVSLAITVGATTSTDTKASFSSWGSCLDLFAPGASITSAYAFGDFDTFVESGTSQAAPHVAGAFALFRQGFPHDITSPFFIPSAPLFLAQNATGGVVTGVPDGTGTTDRLLHVVPPPIDLVLEVEGNPTTDFSFELCEQGGTGCQQATLDDDFTSTLIDRTSFPVTRPTSPTSDPATKTWVLAEHGRPEGFDLVDIACTNDEGTPDLGVGEVAIELDHDDRTRCTFSYEVAEPEPGTITVVQDSEPDDAQDVGYQGCGPLGCGAFTLDDDADPTLARQHSFPAAPGQYTITQSTPDGWDLTDLTCDTGETTDLATATATIDLAEAEAVTCTFTTEPIPDPVPTFADVPLDHPFWADVEWMAAEGISTGYADGTYKPALPVTRQAMSAFLQRLAGATGFTGPATPTFTDVPTDHPFYDEIEWMAAEGITTGFEPGPAYRPLEAVSRQAMSAFLHRLADGPGVGT